MQPKPAPKFTVGQTVNVLGPKWYALANPYEVLKVVNFGGGHWLYRLVGSNSLFSEAQLAETKEAVNDPTP